MDRKILWEKLEKKKIPKDLMENLKGLFEDNTTRVILGKKQSPKIYLYRGLLQGSILSPILYSAFINDPREEIKKNRKGKRGEDEEEILLYADDIAVMTTRKERKEEILKVCEKHSKENNYRYKVKK